MKREKCTFTDGTGDSWRCRISTSTLLKTSADTGLSLEDLAEPGKISINKLLTFIWHSVSTLATARGVSRKAFFEERLTPFLISVGIQALSEALMEAFPEDDMDNTGVKTEKKT